ncbi:MAG: hypothetical protein JRN39_04800 [Nitrososphaerota archaeon]|nr:hypothetical protein [Nitrososphaerota archaeon]
MAKRTFTIDLGGEQVQVEGYDYQKVAIKYLMKRRRSLLSTRDPEKVEALWQKLPKKLSVIGAKDSKSFTVDWKKVGEEEFQGARFVFALAEA